MPFVDYRLFMAQAKMSFVEKMIHSLITFIAKTIQDIFAFIGDTITDSIKDESLFKDMFPTLYSKDVTDIIKGIGLGILILSVVLVVIKMMKEYGQESPSQIFLSIVFSSLYMMIALSFRDEIWKVATKILSLALQVEPVHSTSSEFLGGNLAEDTATLVIDSKLNTARLVLGLIFGVIILIEYFKLVMEVYERYVVTNVLFFLAPIAAGFSVDRKSEVWSRYIQMLISTFIVLFFNILFVKVFCDFGSNFFIAMMPGERSESGSTNIFLAFFINMAYLKVCQRIDQYIDKMGLNTVQAGHGLGSAIAGYAIAASNIARNIAGSKGKREARENAAANTALSASGLNASAFGGDAKNAMNHINSSPSLQSALGNTQNAMHNAFNPYSNMGADTSALNSKDMGFIMSSLAKNNPMVGAKAANTVNSNFDALSATKFDPATAKMGAGVFTAEAINDDGSKFALKLSQEHFAGAEEIKDNDGNSYWMATSPIDGTVGGLDDTLASKFSSPSIEQMGYNQNDNLTYTGDGSYDVHDAYGENVGTLVNSDVAGLGNLATKIQDDAGNQYESLRTGADFDVLMGAKEAQGFAQYADYAASYGVSGGIPVDASAAQRQSATTVADVLEHSDFEAQTGISLRGSTVANTSNYATTGQFDITQTDDKGHVIKSITIGLANNFEGKGGSFTTDNGTTFVFNNNTIVKDGSSSDTKDKKTRLVLNPLKKRQNKTKKR